MMERIAGIRAWLSRNIRMGIERQGDTFGRFTITYLGIGGWEVSLALYREAR